MFRIKEKKFKSIRLTTFACFLLDAPDFCANATELNSAKRGNDRNNNDNIRMI